jgi:hypothetical protein
VDILRIAIVGGGDTARQLITDFLSRPFIQVVGVADLNEDSPGAVVAKRAGIPFTTDLEEFGELDPQPDLVIDVCGKPHVSTTLEATFPEDDEDSPAVVHEVVARLVLSLAADSRVLAPGCDTTLPPALQF